jgi:hypothetical protein
MKVHYLEIVGCRYRVCARIALPSLEIPGKAKIAIYIHGGVDHGLWQS